MRALFLVTLLAPSSSVGAQTLPATDMPRAVFAPTAGQPGSSVFRVCSLQQGPVLVTDTHQSAILVFGYQWHQATQALQSVAIVKPRLGKRITGLDFADLVGSPAPELVIAWSDALVQVVDDATRSTLYEWTVPNGQSTVLELIVADVDADGQKEVVTSGDVSYRVHDAAGNHLWSMDFINGFAREMYVAQMDSDPGLELAYQNGVIDLATRAMQWSLPPTTRTAIRPFDCNGDGKSEFVEAVGRTLRAWSVETQTILLTRDFANDIADFDFADMTPGGAQEILVADRYNNRIRVIDPSTFTLLETISVASDTMRALECADIDSDSDVDILALDSNAAVVVIDSATRQVIGRNFTGHAPIRGPEFGDVDGDGRTDLVVATGSDPAGHFRTRVFLLSPNDLAVTAWGLQFPWLPSRLSDLRLSDLDLDGDFEVVTTCSDPIETITAWDHSPTAGIHVTAQFAPPGLWTAYWAAGTVADIDRDGSLEALGAGLSLDCFAFPSGTPEWSYALPQSPPQSFTDFEIADFDADGRQEIAALNGTTNSIWIFDARTGVLRSTVGTNVSAMQLLESVPSGPRLLVGGLDGSAGVLVDVGTGFTLASRGMLGGQPIVRVGASERLLLTNSAGALQARRGYSNPAWSTSVLTLDSRSELRIHDSTPFQLIASTGNGVFAY